MSTPHASRLTPHASRLTPRKVVRCSAAWIAVEQRDRLLRQGWKVIVHDALGDKVSDDDLVALMLSEGRGSEGT